MSGEPLDFRLIRETIMRNTMGAVRQGPFDSDLYIVTPAVPPGYVLVKRDLLDAMFSSLDHIEGGMPAVVEDAASALAAATGDHA
jgi:hypothetical protein